MNIKRLQVSVKVVTRNCHLLACIIESICSTDYDDIQLFSVSSRCVSHRLVYYSLGSQNVHVLCFFN